MGDKQSKIKDIHQHTDHKQEKMTSKQIRKGKRKRILFVEDDKVCPAAFEDFAAENSFPYDYVIAESVKEAGKILKTEKIDAAVMDYMLGDGTAFDLFEKISSIPFIIVTGTSNQEIAVRAMKAGAYDYLVKDPQANYLKTLSVSVENAIKRKKDEEELKRYREHLELLVENRIGELHKEVNKREQIEDALGRKHSTQSVLNAILSTSLKPFSLVEMLNHILNCIVSIPWLTLKSKGAILLVENGSDELIMTSCKGLDDKLKTLCAKVPIGQCLCGRARVFCLC
jgi:DNA-binding response OmpR family regulator